MAEASTTLVVNGDDFGLSTGVNRGIRSAFERGILRSASLMPNGPAFREAVDMALETPGLDVGVHLSLVGETSVASPEKVRGLADRGGLLPSSYLTFLLAHARGRFGLEEVQAEVEAQLRKVLAAGITPSHLDSHQHLHVYPGIIDLVVGAARSAGIRVIRLPREGGGKGRGGRRRFLNWLCRRAAVKIRRAGLRFADHFWGFSRSGRLDERGLAGLISALGPGVNEIMTHPGFSDPETAARYPWGYRWDEEAGALCSPAVRRLVTAGGIRLAGFGDAWNGASLSSCPEPEIWI